MNRNGWRISLILLAFTALALFTMGCGGGGGGGASSSAGISGSPAGPTTVEVAFGAATATGSSAAPVTVAGPSTIPTMDPAYQWPEEIHKPSRKITHVYMDVVKISLMPSQEVFESEDMDGDVEEGRSADPPEEHEKPHFVTLVPESPICIDLLHLESGKKFARFLNQFDSVPAGTYDKIRVYYKNVRVYVEGRTEPLHFHPTAHSKFDIHFRQGYELVIPVPSATPSDTNPPDGWVKFFRVNLDVVGLKLRIVRGGEEWKGCKVILRPQIFAKFVPPILYSVAGTAEGVPTPTLPVSGTFHVKFGTGPTDIPVAFNASTTWAYSDNVLGRSPWIVDNIPDPMVEPVFRSGAKVMAIGPFDTSLYLQATDIVFTFPYVKEGVVDNGWTSDNTFVLRDAAPDNVVFPEPGKGTAYYDNLSTPHQALDNTFVDNNVFVKARGYKVTEGIQAYWISIGETVGP